MAHLRCPNCKRIVNENSNVPSHCSKCGTSLRGKDLIVASNKPDEKAHCLNCWRNGNDSPPQLEIAAQEERYRKEEYGPDSIETKTTRKCKVCDSSFTSYDTRSGESKNDPGCTVVIVIAVVIWLGVCIYNGVK